MLSSKHDRSKFGMMCVCTRGLMVILALVIASYISYGYISWFIIPYLFVGIPEAETGSD